MARFLPTFWTRQPPGPVRVSARWRSRVMSAWYPNAGCDVVRGVRLTETDPGGWWSRQADKWVGLGARSESGANYLDLGVLTSPGDATRISTLTIATPNDTTLARSSLFDTSNNATTQGFCLNQGYGSDKTKAFLYNGGNFVAESSTGTFVQGVRAVYGVSYSRTNPTNTVKVYKNGVEIISSSFDTAADVAYGQKYCPGGRFATNVLGWQGSLELQVLFPPVLSAAEFALLSANPWALFEPIRRAIFFAPAAAGAGNSVGAAVGTSDAVALSGSLATAVGAGTATALSGSVGQATGAGTANALAGALAQASGAASVAALSGALGQAAGGGVALSLSGSIAAATGAGVAQASSESGSIAAAAGTATAVGLSAAGSIGAVTGTSAVAALAGAIGTATGAGAAAALRGSVGVAAGSGAAAALTGAIGTATGASNVVALPGYVATAEGLGLALGIALGFSPVYQDLRFAIGHRVPGQVRHRAGTEVSNPR